MEANVEIKEVIGRIEKSTKQNRKLGTQKWACKSKKGGGWEIVKTQMETGEAVTYSVAKGKIPTFRQGDVYIQRVRKLTSSKVMKVQNPKLAPGVSQGSQHVIDNLEGVTLYEPLDDVLSGPQIDAEKEFTITHPEHGNVVCDPGTYITTYQQAFAEERKRVED